MNIFVWRNGIGVFYLIIILMRKISIIYTLKNNKYYLLFNEE
jgi:hypothetical protein